MYIVQVHVQVKKDCIGSFKDASLENAANSVKELGITRFDVIQNLDESDRFVLVEVYKTASDPAKHKQTEHYLKWRDTVANMMAEPRQGIKYRNIFPDDNGW